MAKKSKNQQKNNTRNLIGRRYSFSLLQISIFVIVFSATAVYALTRGFAASVRDLPGCSISPANPRAGDQLTVTAQLPAVPSDSKDGKYWVKNQTPYNTAYGDTVMYDAASGTATYPWAADVVSGKYGFYFVYIKNGANPDYVAKRDIIQVSKSCSVLVK